MKISEMTWIKCSDRMPSIDENVLVLDRKDGSYASEVTHWMSLPNSPDKEEAINDWKENLK